MFSFYLFPFNFYEFLNVKNKKLAKIYAKKNDAVKRYIFSGKDFVIPKDIFMKDILKLFEDFINASSF